MADIELVIKMPEKTYKHIMSMQFYIPGARNGKSLLEEILKAIRTGTPLPKGHGRLVDIDLLRDQVSHDEREAFSKHQVWLLLSVHNKKITTIIDADKEQEDEQKIL